MASTAGSWGGVLNKVQPACFFLPEWKRQTNAWWDDRQLLPAAGCWLLVARFCWCLLQDGRTDSSDSRTPSTSRTSCAIMLPEDPRG